MRRLVLLATLLVGAGRTGTRVLSVGSLSHARANLMDEVSASLLIRLLICDSSFQILEFFFFFFFLIKLFSSRD